MHPPPAHHLTISIRTRTAGGRVQPLQGGRFLPRHAAGRLRPRQRHVRGTTDRL